MGFALAWARVLVYRWRNGNVKSARLDASFLRETLHRVLKFLRGAKSCSSLFFLSKDAEVAMERNSGMIRSDRELSFLLISKPHVR